MTFLFTDIEGSTRLLKALGRDRYGEVLAAHNRLLRKAFTDAGGSEIDTKGDSFFVVFRSAGAAVQAVGAAQRALAEHDWPDGVELRVRMGLHTGEASVGPDGYVGYAVHQASRIGDAGHGGQVLLSSTTANLVRHELPATLGLRDLGETPLPDFDGPERLYQLEVDGLPREFPPLSTRTTKPKPRIPRRRTDVQVSDTPLLEREAEVAALLAVVDAAQSGAGRVVAIEGRAGMGKTRLVAEARALADDAGFEVLVARSADLEQEFAYGVVRQLFEPFLASLPPEERDEALSGTAGLSERLFGDAELTGAASGDVSFAVLHGLYWLAANLASKRPTAIVVDDLHWTDAPTLRWLAFLGRRLEGLPLLVVLGMRPPEQAVETQLLTELVSDPTVLVIRPTALTGPAVSAMVELEFGVDPEPEFVEACHAVTGGNPLFVRALVDALHGEGLTPAAEHAERVREIGPEPVARAVSLRLSRLPEEARRFAAAVAVLGDGAELRDVAALAEIDDARLASVAATWLEKADLVRLSTPIVEFVHPVVRLAVYESLAPADRVQAHRRAAELLDTTQAEPERIAAHLDVVGPAGDPFVVDTLRLAADRALVRGAAEAAVRYLRRALAEPPADDETRTDTLCELGLAEQRVDVLAAAEHLKEALGTIEEPLRRARMALELGRSLFRLNRGPEAVRVLEDAMERLRDGEPELREMLEAELINSAGFDTDVIEVSRARIEGVAEDELSGRVGRAVMVSTLRYFDARHGRNRGAVAALADPATVGALIESMPSVAISCAATALMYAEYDDELDRFFDALLDASKRRGELVTLSNMLCFRGLTLAQRGDLEAAVQDLRESDELVRYLPSQQGAIYFHSYLADVLTNRGELDEAQRELDQLGLAEDVADSGHLIFYLGARGWLRYARRDFTGAASDFERLGNCMDAFEMRNPAVLAWRSHLALALLALERADEALALAREEVELARGWGAPRPIGVALRAQGLAEGGEQGIATLRESLAVLEQSSAKLERARTMVQLGAALRRTNKRAEARELLKEGLDLAVRSGAQPLVEQAEAEIAATGARPRRLLLSGAESLTASERRVAFFAAEGLSNKDIAQALFVTTKTVEVHLGSVYRKLGIGSRNELPQALGGHA